MPKGKLDDELKSLTSGIATTGLEYVKHRKKKLRGGIIPLLVMGAQTAIMELASWALNEDQRRAEAEQRRIEEHNQRVWDRINKQDQDFADAMGARDYSEEMGRIQSQWGEEYKNQLRSEMERAKREEQAFYEQEDMERKAYNAQLAEEDRSRFQGFTQQQKLSASQRRLLIQQEEAARRRDIQQSQLNQSRQMFDSLNRTSEKRFNLELQQRLRSAQAQAQAQALTQQRRPVRSVAAKSTRQRIVKV